MNRQVVFLCLALIAAGCGGSIQSEAAVRIYFCTTGTCAHAVTQTQIVAATRRASKSPLVGKVILVSKEDTLTLTPKRPENVERVAALFIAAPTYGIDKIVYPSGP